MITNNLLILAIIKTFLCGFIVLLCGVLLYLFILLIRNEMVYRFRKEMINYDYDLYKKLPDYQELLYSIKPLNKKYWIKKLNHNPPPSGIK